MFNDSITINAASMENDTHEHSPALVTSTSRSSSPNLTTVQQNNAIIRENTIQTRWSAIDRTVFQFLLISSLLALIVIILVLAITYSYHRTVADWGMLGVALTVYASIKIVDITVVIYFLRNPLEYDTFNFHISPPDRLGQFMVKLDRVVSGTLFIVQFLMFFALYDVRAARKHPALFWTVAAIDIYNSFILCLPFFGIVSLICCLPCVIYVLRWVDPEPNRGASEEAINKISKYEYSTNNKTYGSITIEQVDASCAICLREYSNGTKIRVLNCIHHFHQQCADEWFRLQATCPLCVRSVVDGIQGDDDKV